MPIYPPETIFNGLVAVPPLAMPAYKQTVTDPTFGTKITRISGTEMPGSTPSHIRHTYSKTQAWNKTMNFVKLHGARYILNTSDWSIFRNWGYKSESQWSTVAPNKLWYTIGSQFRHIDVVTQVDTLVKDFGGGVTIRMGPWEGNLSEDDTKVTFIVEGTSNVIFYDISANTVSQWNAGGNANDWISITPASHQNVLQKNTTPRSTKLYSRQGTFIRDLFAPGVAEHSDLGYDQANSQVIVKQCNIQMANLSTNAMVNLIPPHGAGYCGHVSMRSYQNRGWATLTTKTTTGKDEIFSIKLSPPYTTVRRFCHTRTTASNYDAEAKGVVSPDGSKVMMNSDWGVVGGPVYAFVASM